MAMGQTHSISQWRHQGRAIALLSLCAVGLRLAACWHWSADLSQDPDGYWGLAERLAQGAGFVTPDGKATAFRPPLYPLILAAFVATGPVGVVVLHTLLGLLAVLGTYWLGRRLGDERMALCAAGFVAVDPLLVRYSPQVMTETLCATLAVLATAGLYLERRAARPAYFPETDFSLRRTFSQQNRGMLRWIALAWGLGIILGLSVLARPTFWIWIALLMVDALVRGTGFWWNRRPGGTVRATAPSTGVGRNWTLLLPLALGLAMLVAPWALRNAKAIGEYKLTTTHGGYTLLLGNNAVFWREVVESEERKAWSGESLSRWQTGLEAELREAGIDPRDELARDAWMQQRAEKNIRADSRAFLRACYFRLTRLWGLLPMGPEEAGMVLSARSALGAYYVMVFLLAAIGVWMWLRREVTVHWAIWGDSAEDVTWRSLLWLALAFTAVHSVYWTDTRMRAPLAVAVGLFAARGVVAIWPKGGARRNGNST